MLSCSLFLWRRSYFCLCLRLRLHPFSPVAAGIAVAGDSLGPLLLCPKLSDERILAVLKLGIKGIVYYDRLDKDLTAAIHVVQQGVFWIPRRILARFLDQVLGRSRPQMPSSHLTDQEARVLELVLRALSNKEIATALRVSVRTAKFHVSNILRKFDLDSRNALILHCLKTPTITSQ